MAPFQEMEGFPTILKMKNGKPVAQFRGQRTQEEMAHFSRPLSRNTSRNTRKPRRKRKIDTRKKRS
jgi:thioredoxin-like negative regulator of GroEL